jgi:hypothetical protein
MTVGKAIFYLLDNSTDLTAIVGTRIYPEVAQQDAPLPYVVYNISNNEPSDTKREPSKLDTANIEVNCYSTSYTEVIDMAVAVRAALDRVTGTYSGVNVQSIAYMNEVIDFDEGQRAYNVSSDYDVRISRTDFEIAQGTPVTGVDLGDLADVNTTGVTDGQVIAYDAATSVWLPATDAGGAEQLNDLSDVIISQPESGEFFRYNGDEWTNDTAAKGDVGLGNVDNTSDANKPVSTATQTALDAKPDNLRQLNDVTIAGPTTDQVLQYDGADWVNATFNTAQTLEDLTDVDIADAPANGSLLEYNLNLGLWQDSGSNRLPTDGIYFHQRYETESEALRAGATATTELYFTCTADGNGLAESASSDTPTAGNVINRKIYYSEAGFADPDTGTWIEFTPAPADDATFATVKAALLEYLKARTGGTVPISLKQTWVETEPSTYLLDQAYGSGAAAAYSTRQLRLAQTDCMTIRRASDGTTTTIGFDGSGNINEAAITTFCTGTTCTVYQWLDQSGNGNTATAPSTGAEPTIYTGGVLVKENGKLALDFDGTNNSLGNSLSLTSYDDTSIFTTIQPSNTVAADRRVVAWGSSTESYPIYAPVQTPNASAGTGTATFARQTSPQINSTESRSAGYGLVTFEANSSGVTTFKNGVNSFTKSFTWQSYTLDQFTIGALKKATSTVNYYDGTLQEVVIYPTNRSTDRTDIEENIGDYFTQNTPLLDTYSGAAAAYSLRLLDSTYTGSAIRVRRSSDNTEQDIGFNVFGELDTVSLTAFAGAGDAFVKTWYDQSGSSNDATQTTTANQPQIVSSGAVIVENGKPAVYFVSGSRYENITASISTLHSAFVVAKGSDNVRQIYGFGGGAAYANFEFGFRVGALTLSWLGNGSSFSAYTSSTAGNTDVNLFSNIYNGTTYKSYVDTAASVNILETRTSSASLSIGARNYSIPMYLSELVLYSSDETANRTGIETNVNTFYSIF